MSEPNSEEQWKELEFPAQHSDTWQAILDLHRRVGLLEHEYWRFRDNKSAEEWWGDRFNHAMDIVRRLAITFEPNAFHALQEEAAALYQRHYSASHPSPASERRGDE